jgi:hypothetical protein
MRAHFCQIFVRLYDDPSLATTVTAGKSSISRSTIPRLKCPESSSDEKKAKKKAKKAAKAAHEEAKKGAPKSTSIL